MKELNIGDVVKTRNYEDMPEQYKSSAMCKISGKKCTIIDVMESKARGETLYRVYFDGSERESKAMLTADCFADLPQGDIETDVWIENEQIHIQIREVDEGGIVVKSHEAYGYNKTGDVYGYMQGLAYAIELLKRRVKEKRA